MVSNCGTSRPGLRFLKTVSVTRGYAAFQLRHFAGTPGRGEAILQQQESTKLVHSNVEVFTFQLLSHMLSDKPPEGASV